MPQDNTPPLPDHAAATQVPAAGSVQAADPISKATAAIESIIAQTTTSPSERASQIAAVKATYIAEKFGAR